MIDSLYNVTRKGWLKALSFILASAMFIAILIKSALFAQYFGREMPYLVLIIFYAMGILWIHGSGFEIKSPLWKAFFLPLLGYIVLFPSFFYLIQL